MTIPPSTSGWTTENILAKMRLLTGTPSSDQLTDDQLLAYANNYYVYTMPFELKEQIQNNYLNFKTIVGQDVYSFPSGYFTDSPGAYADGFPLIFYEDLDIFYQDWPQQYAVDNIAGGDGTTSNFTGGLQNPPIIIGTVFITDGTQVLQDTATSTMTQIIAVGTGIVSYSGTLASFPIVPGSFVPTNTIETFTDNGSGLLVGSTGGTGTINYTTGAWALTFSAAVATGLSIVATYDLATVGVGTLSGNGTGTINYITGAYDVTFSVPPAASTTIYAKYQGYQGNRPQGVLFFNNEFKLRPVPDQVYQIQMQGFIVPTLLTLVDADSQQPTYPMQMEWGQLIAYGASLEIFSDRGDNANYDKYYPLFKRQENVALGRTIQQYTPMQSVGRF